MEELDGGRARDRDRGGQGEGERECASGGGPGERERALAFAFGKAPSEVDFALAFGGMVAEILRRERERKMALGMPGSCESKVDSNTIEGSIYLRRITNLQG